MPTSFERVLWSLGEMDVHRFFFDRCRSLLRWSVPFGLLLGSQLHAQSPVPGANVSQPSLLSDPPETRSPFVLRAINDPGTGKAAFSFAGQEDPPVIRARPGEDIRLTYVNGMSTHSQETG